VKLWEAFKRWWGMRPRLAVCAQCGEMFWYRGDVITTGRPTGRVFWCTDRCMREALGWDKQQPA